MNFLTFDGPVGIRLQSAALRRPVTSDPPAILDRSFVRAPKTLRHPIDGQPAKCRRHLDWLHASFDNPYFHRQGRTMHFSASGVRRRHCDIALHKGIIGRMAAFFIHKGKTNAAMQYNQRSGIRL
jgi:hypothetical protein